MVRRLNENDLAEAEGRKPDVITSGFLPRPPGVSAFRYNAADCPEAPADPIKSYYTLTDLAAEYQLFTHGLLFSHGKLLADPLNDFAENGLLVCVEMDRLLFYGMYRQHAHVLYGCPKEEWDGGLKSFLSTAAGLNRPANFFWRVLVQKVPLPDYPSLNARSVIDVLPTVDIYSFGVDSNKGIVALEPSSTLISKPGFIGCPYQAATWPAEKSTLALSHALLKTGHDDPYRFAEGQEEDKSHER